MPRKTRPTLTPHRCDGPLTDEVGRVHEDEKCANTVRQTKPSKNGMHYCQNNACQAKRVRQYQKGRYAKKKLKQQEAEALFVFEALHRDRIVCPSCGLTNAVRNWIHPDVGYDACKALEPVNPVGQLPFPLIQAVWPQGQLTHNIPGGQVSTASAVDPAPDVREALPTKPTPPPAPPAPPIASAPPIADTPPF